MFQWLNRRNSDAANNTNTKPADVMRRLLEGEKLFLLDVREPAEYREAHVPGSTLVPLGQLAYEMQALPRDSPIVAMCLSGNRSGVAVTMLQRAGFSQVQNLQGGMIAWARSGGPTRSGR